jgi:dihydrofolate reductase
VSAWREATRDIEGEAFLLGGAGVFRAFLEAGAIDEIGIVVLPVLLGSGIPLFDAQAVSFSPERWAAFMEAQTPPAATVLESSGYQAGPEGAVKLIYKSPQAQE